MIQLKNPKKTVKFLYLYMTLPLLLVAGALWVATLSSGGDEKSAAEPSLEKISFSVSSLDSADAGAAAAMTCMDKNDCDIGERCIEGSCFNPLVEAATVREATRHSHPPRATPVDSGIGGAGWAAIIASIMGGLTGLMGAITQAILAFLAVRERRRSQ